ncbi:MAG: hypothetical protein IKJ17_04190 [Clostridia bacterium]|nr:hypothetical protein [Clostridia bacterium]
MDNYKSANAYDLSLFDPMRNQFASVQVRQRAKNSIVAKTRRNATFNLAITVLITAMCCIWLACCSTYNEISSQVSSAKAEYMSLCKEEEALELRFERKFNLEEIERIAIEDYGMARVTSNGITYIDTFTEDNVEIVSSEDNFAVALFKRIFS